MGFKNEGGRIAVDWRRKEWPRKVD